MRRPHEDPLPNVEYVTDATLLVTPRPGTSGNVRLNGGGMVKIPTAGITLDTGDAGHNGINTGSTLQTSKWMYLYLYDNAGTAAVTLDETGPVGGGPGGGLTNYRYIGAQRTTSVDALAPYYIQDGHCYMVNLGIRFYTIPTSANTSWHTLGTSLTVGYQCIPETAGDIFFSFSQDCDTGGSGRCTLDHATDWGVPTWSTSGSATFERTFYMDLNNDDLDIRRRWLPNINQTLYQQRSVGQGGTRGYISVMGYRDRYLVR